MDKQETKKLVVFLTHRICWINEQNILLDPVLHLCSKEDIVLLYRLYIGETRNDIALLFHIKTHTLTQRVSRLKEKLKPLLSETEYEAFFH